MPKFLDRWMIQALTESASQIVNQARSNASWSSEIPRAIKLGEAKATQNGYEITIQLDISKEGGVPQAAAFEFGSGIHRTRGTPGTYKIKPKNATMLAFPWNPANPIGALFSPKVIDFLEDENIWLFKEVDHPGVAPRAFITPAIQAYKPTFKTKILKAFRGGIKESITPRIEIIE